MATNEIDIKDEDLHESDFTPEELESEDVDWKAKAQELKGIAKRRATQLKKAKEALANPPKPELPVKKGESKSDDKLLERLDKMALKVSGITEADEVELFNNWKEQTAREADDIVGNVIFKKELEDLRTAKANLRATSDIKGEGDRSGGAKNNPEYWIAKATKGKDGQLEFPEETPKELFEKIVNKISENEPSQSKKLKFYNE